MRFVVRADIENGQFLARMKLEIGIALHHDCASVPPHFELRGVGNCILFDISNRQGVRDQRSIASNGQITVAR